MATPPSVITHMPVPPMKDEEEKLISEIYLKAMNADEMYQQLRRDLEGKLSGAPPAPESGEIHPGSVFLNLRDVPNHHILDLELDPPSRYIDFDNYHPIFRPEGWVMLAGESYTNQAWVAMTAARALATKFLTTPEMQSFWYRLAFGQSVSINGKRYLQRSPWEDDLPAAEKAFRDLLNDLASKVRFWWCPEQLATGETCDGVFCRSWLRVAHCLDIQTMEAMARRVPDWNQPMYFDSFIGLSSRLLYHLVSPMSSARNDASAMMRLQFHIATTLCHEIAHAIYAYRGLEEPEAYIFESDQIAEAGFSWAFNVLDAEISLPLRGPSVHDVECTAARGWNIFGFPRLSRFIDMRWINAWFRKDTWDSIDKVMREGSMKVPSMPGVPVTLIWAADRFAYGPLGWRYYTIIYQDETVVLPDWTVGNFDGPPSGVDLETWFVEVSREEKTAALAMGMPEWVFKHPQGTYEGFIQSWNGRRTMIIELRSF